MIVNHALVFAALGWPVFPCNPQTKQPMTRRGFYDASIDAEKIKRWWKNNPNAMIGMPTGNVSGMFVLDINPPNGLTLAECVSMIEAEIETDMRPQRSAKTPLGMHYYFKMPEGVDIRNRGKLLNGAIDCVRGNGGYVIAPPSKRYDGAEYAWFTSYSAVEPTQKLIDLVTRK